MIVENDTLIEIYDYLAEVEPDTKLQEVCIELAKKYNISHEVCGQLINSFNKQYCTSCGGRYNKC